MNSVFEQSYKDIEYIIIDGGSTDGSKAFIESKEKNLAYWVSEPDQGIYHAMNKGIDQATGEYLLFMNSGDCLVDPLVIEKFVGFNPVEDIVYGDPLVREGNTWKRKFMPKEMSIGVALTNSLAHQAEFYRGTLFIGTFRYDTSYICSGDRSLTNTAIIFKNATTRYIDLIVCYFENPGVSADAGLRFKERKRFLNENFDPFFIRLFKDYQQLNIELKALNNSSLIQAARWILNQRAKILKYFNKNS